MKTIMKVKSHIKYEYDKEEKIWYVHGNGNMPIDRLGEVAKVYIKATDGEILYIWHEQ